MNKNAFTMKNWLSAFVAILSFVGLVISNSSIGATTMVSMNIAQLSENAETAFVTRIQSIETSETQGRACEVISGLVTDVVFGDVKTSEVIEWRQFKLGHTLSLPGMPKYEVGKEYLIFLSGPGTGMGFKSPVGLGQGAFTVSRDPATNMATARNGYMNATLARGLNLEKAASDMVAADARGRSLTGKARQQEVQRVVLQLGGRQNASLDTLKQAAQFFRKQQTKGRSVSQDYRSTTPLQRGKGISRR